jgi:histidinol-phosphate aminotransferase
MTRITPRDHLVGVERSNERHEGREGFVCLDRNERASPFPDATLRDMFASVTSRDLMAYPDPGPFVSRLARQTGRGEDWIVETAGSDAGLRRVMMAYLRPGGTVLFANPSYAMYDIYTRVFEGVAKRIDYSPDLSFDVSAFCAAMTPGVELVILANPNQPTGTAVSQDGVAAIVQRAAQIGAVCVLDEAYYPFFPETALDLVGRFDNLVVVRSMSKYPGVAGLRLGYAVGAPALIKGLIAVRGGSEISGVSLALGCYLLDHPEIAESHRSAVEAGRKILLDAAHRLGFAATPSVASFQVLRCPAGLDAVAITQELEQRRYLIKSGFKHVSMNQCLRISLDGPGIMRPFVSALEDAARVLRQPATA